MSGVTVLRMAKLASLASSYAVMRGGPRCLGWRRMATHGMAECTRTSHLIRAQHDPTPWSPLRSRLASQLGRIALLHRREERIHVQVDDGGGSTQETVVPAGGVSIAS